MANLKLEQITKSFDNELVLKNINLSVADGEFVSLVGPSGCGKSTLLRVIAGLEQQSSGSVSIAGRNVSGVRAADRDLSMVFQSYALYPHLTVAENIAIPLQMRRLNARQRIPLFGCAFKRTREKHKDIANEVVNAAKMLEIEALLDRKPGQLSGGQRQRVALGRAIVRNPAAFLFDEPLSNLDAKLRVQTRCEIAELHRRLGATFVYVTHDQVEAMTMSSRIAVMMRGEILQCAAPDVIYEDPEDVEVAEFIGSPKINIFSANIRDGSLHLANRSFPLNHSVAAETNLRVGVRPESIRLSSSDGALAGRVVHLENLGSELFVQIDTPGLDSRVVLRAFPESRRQLAVGNIVSFIFNPGKLLVFGSDGTRRRQFEAALDPQVAVA
ncbi:MAG: multiple sugar transport system ATP-binding protein [bacterium]|jgi:multiple sugar transport system ATP-binding protein